ncbi:heavy metal translocating P-type ATPase [Candidatus Albibeggiatoa sp. nov. NOAA]|uniref:heavy metal translocating P-type ATPase n=1 Tax=Candidatus Albibeggiatoa sp. nov. NOAA TaxID=3162724 RepID=UPI0032F2C360|nr:heavy metal translocating P-type ATPase [Thiotrichaceae bacterium]
MIPLVPILLAGSGIALAAKAGVHKRVAKVFKKVDEKYQQFFEKNIDSQFVSQERNQQLQEFIHNDKQEEANINRNLGISIVNTTTAIIGSFFYPPLLILTAIGVLYTTYPIVKQSIITAVYEKRIAYLSHVGVASVLFGLLGGFYIISSAMMLVVLLALKIAARTKNYSQNMLMSTFAVQPPSTVWISVDNVETEIAFSALQIGDVLVLNAGQTVPIDGHVVDGNALIDQHILTGESQPVEKSNKDKVFANTLILSGKIYVAVDQTGSETIAMQISQILANTSDSHLDHQARSEKIADSLALPVLAASGLAWMTVGTTGAVTILNSGLGSTMMFSGPLSMLSFLNIASHNGILVKDGRSLELLHTIDTVIFDKTGTLTIEQPEVSEIHHYHDWTKQQVLYFAAIAEYRQTHPIAKAILTASAQYDIELAAPDESHYQIGFGIHVRYQQQDIKVGSLRFMRSANIEIPKQVEAQHQKAIEWGNSFVAVAVGNTLIGTIELQVQLRPETEELIKQLHQRKLKLYILSGDHYHPTQHLAQRLEMDGFFAEVLPEGKADIVKQLQDEGRKVCFVGDGINDAIALKQADISVSLRGATTVATDSAQIIILSQSLIQLDQLFNIAESFHDNLSRTLKLSYIPGSIVISGAFLFHFGMLAALLLYSAGLTATISHALSPMLKLPKEAN